MDAGPGQSNEGDPVDAHDVVADRQLRETAERELQERGRELREAAERELQDAADQARELWETAGREHRLRDLVTEAGFADTFSALAGLARRWSEHPEVDPRAAAELRLLGRRLDALARDVSTSTRLN